MDVMDSVRKLLMNGTKASSTVLVISDIQAPFEHHKTLEFLCRVRDKYRPSRTICIGDEADYHALGSWDSDPDGFSAGDEQAAMQKFMLKLWKEFPEGVSCISNHTMRPYRKAFQHGIPESMLKGYHELLKAPPEWSWEPYVIVDGVRYEHGDAIAGSNLFAAAINGNHRSTVFGHHHSKAGIMWFRKVETKPMFAMNVGCLIDDRKYAFKYGKSMKDRPNLGCGVVIDGVFPVFIPLETMF